MGKRWIGSSDVVVNAQTGALLVEEASGGGDASPSSMVGGTKTVAATATPEPLVAASTPCKSVWIGAPVSAAGASVNTKPVWIGDSANQNIPLLPDDSMGVVIRIDDAAKLYVRVGASGEGVSYRVVA